MTITNAEILSGVVFDLDGTLVDTAADICQALNDALATRGLSPLAVPSVRLIVGAGPQVLVERALHALDVRDRVSLVDYLTQEFERSYLERGNRQSRLFDGVESCLSELNARRVPMGVCSNKPHHLCLAGLSDLGVLRYFTAINGTSPGVPKKPDPTLLLRTLDRLGSRPQSALDIGDSETDVTTARAAGVPVALVRYGYTAKPADELGADLVINTFADLLRILFIPPTARPLLRSATS